MVAGTAEQVETVVHGSVLVAGSSPCTVSAFTRTGITAPVARLKVRCPNTTFSLAPYPQDPRHRLLTSQNRSNLPRMTRNRDIRIPIMREHIIQHSSTPHILSTIRLSRRCIPQGILLRKALLERPPGIILSNPRLVIPPITSMHANSLSKKLLDSGYEQMAPRQVKPIKRHLCSMQTSSQRRHVVALRRGDLLLADFGSPEIMRYLRLCHSGVSQLCVRPHYRAIAVQLGPVAVPRRSPVEGFGDVVRAFAVAAEDQELVLHV